MSQTLYKFRVVHPTKALEIFNQMKVDLKDVECFDFNNEFGLTLVRNSDWSSDDKEILDSYKEELSDFYYSYNNETLLFIQVLKCKTYGGVFGNGFLAVNNDVLYKFKNYYEKQTEAIFPIEEWLITEEDLKKGFTFIYGH